MASQKPKKKHTLLDHAMYELAYTGMSDDPDGKIVADKVIALVEVLLAQDNDKSEADMIIWMFDRIVNFRPLTQLTSEPEEWEEITEIAYTPEQIKGGLRKWQSLRSPSVFSQDGGKTWIDVSNGTEGITITKEEVFNGNPTGKTSEGGEGNNKTKKAPRQKRPEKGRKEDRPSERERIAKQSAKKKAGKGLRPKDVGGHASRGSKANRSKPNKQSPQTKADSGETSSEGQKSSNKGGKA